MLYLFARTLAVSALAGSALACSPQQRIDGLKLGLENAVNGNPADNDRVPFAPNATFDMQINNVTIRLGNDGPSSRAALQAFHSMGVSINATYHDDGDRTVTATGVLRAKLSLPIPLLGESKFFQIDIPGYAQQVYDNDRCLFYRTIGILHPPANMQDLVVVAVKAMVKVGRAVPLTSGGPILL